MERNRSYKERGHGKKDVTKRVGMEKKRCRRERA